MNRWLVLLGFRVYFMCHLRAMCAFWPSLPQKGIAPVGLETIRKGCRKPRRLCQNVSVLNDLISHLLFQQAVHPSRPTGQNNNSSSLTRERRPARALTADQHGRPVAERATACEDRACATSSERQIGGGLREPGQRAVEGGQTSSEVPATRKTDHPGPSQIPRVFAGSITSLPSKASPSRSLSSDSERGPRSERGPLPRLQTAFTGRLGQPPRGPLSLHMYSRKNVFLQHSLHTAELQALAQQDG